VAFRMTVPSRGIHLEVRAETATRVQTSTRRRLFLPGKSMNLGRIGRLRIVASHDQRRPPFEGACNRPNSETRPMTYRARRTACFVRAFAFIVDVRTVRFTFRVALAFVAFAGRVTLV
jgi:hypothetical protein